MAMVTEAAAVQNSLAPLMADLAGAVASPALPDAARATAVQLLAAQTPLDASVTAGSLRSAVQGSGLFLEAGLANALVQPGPVATPDLSSDLKALLLRLTADLAPAETDAAAIQAAATEAVPSPVRSPAPSRSAADRPAPPIKGGATAGQPAAQPAPELEAGGEALIHVLRQGAQAALARVQLSQAASRPEPGAPAHWTFETPVATPHGLAIAQFDIRRDGKGADAGSPEAPEPSWRARFSLNVEPSGPVHADVSLSAGRARVTLWAERESARVSLSAGQGELAGALATEQGDDVAVRVIGGAPPQQAPAAGQLVDRRS
ncbi:MAG: flagellar hook-length control protein FliK [Caulobacterales bacterium]